MLNIDFLKINQMIIAEKRIPLMHDVLTVWVWCFLIIFASEVDFDRGKV